MSESNEWEVRYQKGHTGWDRGETSPNLNYWIEEGLLKPCRILIPGCGNGHEVITLAEKGFEVVAVDIASTPIKKLKKAVVSNQLNVELVQADYFTWNPSGKFDAIYEQTSLCALPKEKWNAYEECLFDWLKPKSSIFAQFMQTGREDGPPFHCDTASMKKVFISNRWQWSNQHESTITHSEDLYENLFILTKH